MGWGRSVSKLYEVKRRQCERCKLRLDALEAEYEAIANAINAQNNPAEREQLKRQLAQCEQEMNQAARQYDALEAELNGLENTSGRIPTQLAAVAETLQVLTDLLTPYEAQIARDLETAYRSVRPVDWRGDRSYAMPKTLPGLFADLEDMPPDREGNTALLKFLAALVTAIDGAHAMLSRQLQQWAEPKYPGFIALLSQVRATATPTRHQTDSYLMVKLDRSGTADRQDGDRYFVKAWFILDGHNYQPGTAQGYHPLPIPGTAEDSEKAFTLGEIQSFLKAFLQESCAEYFRHHHQPLQNLIIEFFLPPELLNCDVDSWVIEEDDDNVMPESIGCQHQVRLRSSNRLHKTYLLSPRAGSWKNKSGLMQQCAQQVANGAVVAADGAPPKWLLQQLSQAHVVGLKLAQGPLSIGKESAFAAFQSSGGSMAIWLRQPLSTVPCAVHLNQVLACCLGEVPETVKQQRLEAFPHNPDSHIGHHLALLWEDFNRLTPDCDFLSMA
jgi:arsenate reductase-like glutaredoxin family protein